MIHGKISRGQLVYVVPKDRRCSPFCAYVISVGPKYITITGLALSERRFHVQSGLNIHGGYELYDSQKAYNDRVQELKENKELNSYCEQRLCYLSNEQLRTIKSLIQKFLAK